MNYDEFAFFNRQLAAMLRDGIPLEGALKELSVGMKSGTLRDEVGRIEADLSQGMPLKEALARGKLPQFYTHMLEIGRRSNDLPGVLTLLADYYENAHALWSRLKGLMVYPFIVIVVSLALTVGLSFILQAFLTDFASVLQRRSPVLTASLWFSPALLALLLVLGLAALSMPTWRARLRWRLPGFREASLTQLAAAMALMLRNGTTLPEALVLAQAVESNSPAGAALARWHHLVASGHGTPAQWPPSIHPFPAMFFWLVQKGGEDLAAGFQKASDIYRARASYRIELALYGALPISILALGQMVLWQVVPLFQTMAWLMNNLGGWE